MMLSLHDYVVWAINIGLNCALVWLTWNKSTCSRWPIFRLFLQVSLVKSFALLAVSQRGDDHLYFLTYWTLQVVLLPFYLGVVYEIFSDLFRPFWTIPRAPLLALVSFLVIVECAALAMAIVRPGSYADQLSGVAHASERAIVVIIVAALAFVLLFSRYFRMPWRPRTAGIAAGMFGFFALRLLVLGLQSGANTRHLLLLRTISMLSFLAAQAFWATTLIRTRALYSPLASAEIEQLQSETRGLRDAMRRTLGQLQQAQSVKETGN